MVRLVNVLNLSQINNIKEKLKSIKNVCACGLTGFGTCTTKPSVRIFFHQELPQADKYKILDDVYEVMNECNLHDSEVTDVRWCSGGFEIFYNLSY